MTPRRHPAAAEQFEATVDPAALTKADAIFLCVPTPFDAAKTPVLDFVRSAAATVGAGLVPGQLVILQSTTYPGTTTEIVQPILEAESGLRAGVDLPAYYARPTAGTGFPVVLVNEEIFGVHEYIKDTCRRLAKLGYMAVAPEL